MEKGISELLARVRPRLKRILARYRIPVADAEDLVQNACLTLVRSWERIEDPEAWLLGTLRLMCLDYHRQCRRRGWLQVLDPQLLADLAPALSPPQKEAERLWDLCALAALLSRRYQLVLCMRYRLGMTPAEISTLLGYPPNSIRKLSSRALARMRRAYG